MHDYLCNDSGILLFHERHMVGFFLIVPSPLRGGREIYNEVLLSLLTCMVHHTGLCHNLAEGADLYPVINLIIISLNF